MISQSTWGAEDGYKLGFETDQVRKNGGGWRETGGDGDV